MSRFRWLTPALLLLVAGLESRPAAAGTIFMANCTFPSRIVLVGTDAAGTADPIGEFLVVARDRAGMVVPNVQARAILIQCNDLRLCPEQEGLTVSCTESSVLKYTDASGSAWLTVVGYADPALSELGAHGACAQITLDGWGTEALPVSVLDLDGGGLGPGDLSRVLADHFSDQFWSRSDFDGDGSVGPADLSFWLTAFFAAGSSAGCRVPYCP